MHMESKETIVLEERSGHYYILVDEKLILRTTDKRTAEHYYSQMTSDQWQGPRLIVPMHSSRTP
jgi:hypothetical protein